MLVSEKRMEVLYKYDAASVKHWEKKLSKLNGQEECPDEISRTYQCWGSGTLLSDVAG